jgi:hypothetical protein
VLFDSPAPRDPGCTVNPLIRISGRRGPSLSMKLSTRCIPAVKSNTRRGEMIFWLPIARFVTLTGTS